MKIEKFSDGNIIRVTIEGEEAEAIIEKVANLINLQKYMNDILETLKEMLGEKEKIDEYSVASLYTSEIEIQAYFAKENYIEEAIEMSQKVIFNDGHPIIDFSQLIESILGVDYDDPYDYPEINESIQDIDVVMPVFESLDDCIDFCKKFSFYDGTVYKYDGKFYLSLSQDTLEEIGDEMGEFANLVYGDKVYFIQEHAEIIIEEGAIPKLREL